MVQKFIKIHSEDLVAVALCPLEKGTVCNCRWTRGYTY